MCKASDTSPDTAIYSHPLTLSHSYETSSLTKGHTYASLTVNCAATGAPAPPVPGATYPQSKSSRISISSPLRRLPLPPRTPLRKTQAAPRPGSRPGILSMHVRGLVHAHPLSTCIRLRSRVETYRRRTVTSRVAPAAVAGGGVLAACMYEHYRMHGQVSVVSIDRVSRSVGFR